MKKFRHLSEQLDVSSPHGPNAGRFATGAPKKPFTTQIQATPRREVPMESAPEAGDDINNQPSPELVRKNGKVKSADPMADSEIGSMSRYMPEETIDEIVTPDLKSDLSSLDSSSFKKKHGKSKIEAHKYVSEARMSAAMKLQRAYQREQEKSERERKAGAEVLKKPVKEESELTEARANTQAVRQGLSKRQKAAPSAEAQAEKSKEHNAAWDMLQAHIAKKKQESSGLPKKKLNESRKAEIVKQASKDAKKKSKEKDKEVATDKFQPDPTLDSQVIKTD